MSYPLYELRALNEIAPGTILAGGFLRDRIFRRPVKDLDFFAPYGLTCETLRKAFPAARPESYSNWLEYSTDEVSAVYDLGTINGLPAQLIVLEQGLDPSARVAHMDFGFCQVHIGINEGLTTTRAFEEDNRNNTATLVYCESKREFDRSMRRWDRLKLKYPERTLVIPEQFKQWMQ